MSGRSAESRLRGLYVISDDRRAGAVVLAATAREALRGGARIVQYRDKGHDAVRRLDEARALRALTREFDVPLLINDDIDLAIEVAADGVHIGRDDTDLRSARTKLPAGSLIGVSCYDRYELAKKAVASGADYIAFGSFFPSPTKPNAVRAPRGLLEQTRKELGVPTVAIGGISPENGAALVAAGADMLAVISAVFAAGDARAAAEAFAPCFAPPKETDR